MAQIYTSYVNNVKELKAASKRYQIFEVEFGTFAELRKHDITVETLTDLIPSKNLNLSFKTGRVTEPEFIALYQDEIKDVDFDAMRTYFESLEKDVLLVGWSRPGIGTRAIVAEKLKAIELPMLKPRSTIPSFKRS